MWIILRAQVFPELFQERIVLLEKFPLLAGEILIDPVLYKYPAIRKVERFVHTQEPLKVSSTLAGHHGEGVMSAGPGPRGIDGATVVFEKYTAKTRSSVSR